MRKITLPAAGLLIISALFFSTANLSSAEQNNDLPEGMEIQRVDSNPGFKLVVPKGSTIKKVGDLKVVEGSGEYAARRLEEFGQRLDQMNADLESLRKDMEEIKNTITKIQNPA
jgi:hypothetical protein